MSFNPMFSNKRRNKNKVSIVRNLEDGQGSAAASERKPRSDKKTDIKIPLTKEQRIIVRRMARQYNMDPTPFTEYLVKKGLARGIPFGKPREAYPSGSQLSFHARLEANFLEKLDNWRIEWDCSRREAAYRILMGMINAEGGR